MLAIDKSLTTDVKTEASVQNEGVETDLVGWADSFAIRVITRFLTDAKQDFSPEDRVSPRKITTTSRWSPSSILASAEKTRCDKDVLGSADASKVAPLSEESSEIKSSTDITAGGEEDSDVEVLAVLTRPKSKSKKVAEPKKASANSLEWHSPGPYVSQRHTLASHVRPLHSSAPQPLNSTPRQNRPISQSLPLAPDTDSASTPETERIIQKRLSRLFSSPVKAASSKAASLALLRLSLAEDADFRAVILRRKEELRLELKACAGTEPAARRCSLQISQRDMWIAYLTFRIKLTSAVVYDEGVAASIIGRAEVLEEKKFTFPFNVDPLSLLSTLLRRVPFINDQKLPAVSQKRSDCLRFTLGFIRSLERDYGIELLRAETWIGVLSSDNAEIRKRDMEISYWKMWIATFGFAAALIETTVTDGGRGDESKLGMGREAETRLVKELPQLGRSSHSNAIKNYMANFAHLLQKDKDSPPTTG